MSTKYDVALDAGHGGFGVTPGKRTPDNEYEWNFNSKVVKSAIAVLEAHGVKVLRTDDPTGKTDVSLGDRVKKANNAKVKLFVSFHHNALDGVWGTHTGTETYTCVSAPTDSVRLAKEVHSRVLEAYGLRDRGLKKADFQVIKYTNMAAILIEGGYMDSTIDIKKLRDDKVLAEAGRKVAEGILAYLGIKYNSSTETSKPVNTTPETKPVPTDGWYRVRKSWTDKASQVGAFRDKNLAIEEAKDKPGYSVYDDDGKVVYPVKTPVTENSKAPEQKADTSVAGKRVESIYDGKEGLNFYSKPSWSSADKVGVFLKGQGWTIVEKLKVNGSDMYKVKNTKGATFYITASTKYVKVVNDVEEKATTTTPAKSTSTRTSIPTVGHIQIVNVANAAFICDKPSSTNSKNLGTATKGSKLPISGSVPGWFEVIYNGKRAYVNDKYGKRV